MESAEGVAVGLVDRIGAAVFVRPLFSRPSRCHDKTPGSVRSVKLRGIHALLPLGRTDILYARMRP